MKQYAGLDVSLKEISICVVDVDGAVLVRGTVLTEPEAVASFLAKQQITPERIVHESGQLSIWLQRGLVKLSLPVTCIDARRAHKALSAKLNKSDRADAEGLANLARTGWFTAVHVRSETAAPFTHWCTVPFRDGGRMPIGFRATGIDVLTPQSRKPPVIDKPQALRFVLKVLIAYGGLSPGSMVDVTHAKNGPWDFIVGKSRHSVVPGMRIPGALPTHRSLRI